MTDLKQQIIAIAKEIGISKIGFTTADNFDYLKKNTDACTRSRDKLRL